MKREFHLCCARPRISPHWQAYDELIDLFEFSLLELGFNVSRSFNLLNPKARNIVFGVHWFGVNLLNQLPPDTIIFNTEQLHLLKDIDQKLSSEASESTYLNSVLQFASRYQTWDYSLRNIQRFKELGITSVRLFQFGYQSRLERIAMLEPKDVDVLFYGAINERRRSILRTLEQAGLRVKALFNVYGQERDEWIGRARLVLNMHQIESGNLELIRLFYLVLNKVPTVSEFDFSCAIEPPFSDQLELANYESLCERVLKYLASSELKSQSLERAFQALRIKPQSAILASLLD